MKLKIGQIVYLKPDGNFWRGKRDDETIFEAEVEKIGTKYGTLKLPERMTNCNTQFDLEDMNEKSNYTPNYQVFVKREDIYDKPKLIKTIINDLGHLNYEQLRKVKGTICSINFTAL